MVKSKLIIKIVFILFNFTLLNAQNDCEIQIKGCKIQKKKYLPVLLEFSNNGENDITLLVPPGIRGSLADTPSFRFHGWYVNLKDENGEIEPVGYDKYLPFQKQKNIKLKTDLGVFYIDSDYFRTQGAEIITLKKGETINYKLIVIISKSIYKGLKVGKTYTLNISYDSDEIDKKSISDTLTFTNDLYLEDSLYFKKPFIF